jgi:origin recognition complex subunit 3
MRSSRSYTYVHIFNLCRLYPDSIIIPNLNQLAHLKHFEDPLTIFVQDSNRIGSSVHLAASFPFFDYLLTRIHAPNPNIPPPPSDSNTWRIQSILSLISSVDSARVAFRAKMRKTKVALGLMKRVKDYMLRQGWKSADDRSAVELMVEALKGRLGRDGRYLGTMVKYAPCFLRFIILEGSGR